MKDIALSLGVPLKPNAKEWISFLQTSGTVFGSHIIMLEYEKEYPLSFIAYYIQKHRSILTTIDLADPLYTSLAVFEQMLSTTFLGNQCIFLIKTAWNELTGVQQKFLLRLIGTYTGPHYCIIPIEKVMLSDKKNEQPYTVPVPSILTLEDATHFLKLECVFNPIVEKLLRKMFERLTHISFDTILMLCNYTSVISNNIIDDFERYVVPQLLNSKHSLYELSGQLFAKKTSFFKIWEAVESTYSLPFWTTFWCEQFMKAALFILYKKHGSLQEAKVIGTGLPFSFLNKDWRMYSAKGLVRGYAVLYEYDCRFKDNALIKSLDSFFIMFFNKHFD